MIGLEDRQHLARNIHAAHQAGARLKPSLRRPPVSTCVRCSAGKPVAGSPRATAGPRRGARCRRMR
jgi:hypothetical protein